jgi:hypothetical protein
MHGRATARLCVRSLRFSGARGWAWCGAVCRRGISYGRAEVMNEKHRDVPIGGRRGKA